MTKKPSLGVIVPIFNEEKYLEESVGRLLKINSINQIILVDDSSNDGSFKLAKKLEEKNKIIQVLKTTENLGKGNAVKTGIEILDTDYVVVHDADLEYFPEDIAEMFEVSLQNPNNLILGSRTIGEKERNNLYYFTYLGNKIFSYIFSILNSYKVSDIASCYWLLEVEKLKRIDIQEKGFAIEVEVLSKYLKKNKKIIEVPISYDGRLFSEGKKINLRDGLLILLKIIKYSKLFSINKI